MNLTKIEWAVLFFAILTYLGALVVVDPFGTDNAANDFKILTPIVIGLLGIYFARMQFIINRRKSNMDLFDKRFSIYESVYKFVSSVHDYSACNCSVGPHAYEHKTKEKERAKKISDLMKDVKVKIELSSVITDSELTEKIKEYTKLAITTFDLKRTYNQETLDYYNMNPSFSPDVKQNDKILKEIVDTKLRADFEKYFTIK